MPELSAATCVTAVPGLLRRAWPAEPSAAVYVPASGRTHLISLLAFAILEQSAAQTRSLAELARSIFELEPSVSAAACNAGEISANLAPIDADDHARMLEAAHGLIQAGLLHIVQCP